MDIIDIGGGFTLIHEDDEKNFYEVAPLISEVIDELFPTEQFPHLKFMGEPGRLISESAVSLFSKIVLVKERVSGEPNYFLNNGIY